jgi:hypothetical protein
MVKDIVDEMIDRCSAVYNIRDSIEEARIRAEQATDERQKRSHAQKGAFYSYARFTTQIGSQSGLLNLRRYFSLIVFQSYLQSTQPDTMRSFESLETYVKNRPGPFDPVTLFATAK